MMGRLKAYYHEELTKLDEAFDIDSGYKEQEMTEAELEQYLNKLHEEWLMKHQAYTYEDNYKEN